MEQVYSFNPGAHTVLMLVQWVDDGDWYLTDVG